MLLPRSWHPHRSLHNPVAEKKRCYKLGNKLYQCPHRYCNPVSKSLPKTVENTTKDKNIDKLEITQTCLRQNTVHVTIRNDHCSPAVCSKHFVRTNYQMSIYYVYLLLVCLSGYCGLLRSKSFFFFMDG